MLGILICKLLIMAKLCHLVYFVVSLNFIGEIISLSVSDDNDDGGRIVGGEDADIMEVPYQVSVHLNGRHKCGASILAANWAVSAAHCFRKLKENDNVTLVVGTSYSNQGGQEHLIEKIISHEQFNHLTYNNDIAILKVKNPFKLRSPGVNCIRLPNQATPAGTIALATGWGDLQEGGSESERLQKVSLPVISNSKCNKSHSGKITENMLCAGYKKGGKDTCQADSGGPLAIHRELIGIVSFGIGCARPKYYGVYTDVYALRNWIVGITGPLKC